MEGSGGLDVCVEGAGAAPTTPECNGGEWGPEAKECGRSCAAKGVPCETLTCGRGDVFTRICKGTGDVKERLPGHAAR